MKSLVLVTLMLTGLLIVTGAHADADLFASFHADYDLERDGLGSAHSVFTLDKDADGSYSYKSVLHATGLAALFFSDVITETSRFQVVDGRPRATSYTYTETGKHPKSENIQFAWERKVGVTDEDGKTRKKPLTTDMCDVQMLQLLLASDVAAGKLADSYKILTHGDIVEYKTETLPDAKIRAASIVYDTKVVALHDENKGRTITAWLSPALHYLPVQIRQAQSDKAGVTLTLMDISFDSAAPTAASKSGAK